MVNEENERGRQFVNQEVQKISEEDVRAAQQRMKSGKVAGPDDISVEV